MSSQNLDSFLMITNASNNDAVLFLRATNGNLDEAINLYYTHSGDVSKLDLPKNTLSHRHGNDINNDNDSLLPSTMNEEKIDSLIWSCEICTFINSFKHKNCTMCNKERSENANKIINDIIHEQQENDLKEILKLHPFPINTLLLEGYLRHHFNDNIPQVILDICFKFFYQKPQYERKQMMSLGHQNFIDTAKIGDSWYAVNAKWYHEWVKFTEFELNDSQIIGGIENLDKKWILRPNPMDNSTLCKDVNEHCNVLKSNISQQDNDEVIWLSPDEWQLLYSWYGANHVFGRKIFMSLSNQKYICTHPIFINTIYCDKNNGQIDFKTKQKRSVGSTQTLISVAMELEEELYGITRTIRSNQQFVNVPYVHVWTKFGVAKPIYPIDKKVKVLPDMLTNEDMERWVEIPDDYLKSEIKDIFNGLNEEDMTLMIECKNVPKYKLPNDDDDDEDKDDDEKEEQQKQQFFGKVWPRSKPVLVWESLQIGDIVDAVDEQDKWYESMIRYKGSEEKENNEIFEYIIVHYIGWNIKWDERISKHDFSIKVRPRNTMTTGPHRPRRRL